MRSRPLVSAIMPTRGRCQWAREAVEMFRAQTYPLKELVIVDDQMDRSFQAAPEATLYRVAPRLTVGEKRNMACSMATGQIICHWDSDDVYLADRIEAQLAQLLESGADLVGYRSMEFVEADGAMRRFEFSSSDPNFTIGVSMMYWRDAWEKCPFPPRQTMEDGLFMALQANRRGFPSEGKIVARIHNGNTADKREPHYLSGREWRQIA